MEDKINHKLIILGKKCTYKSRNVPKCTVLSLLIFSLPLLKKISEIYSPVIFSIHLIQKTHIECMLSDS